MYRIVVIFFVKRILFFVSYYFLIALIAVRLVQLVIKMINFTLFTLRLGERWKYKCSCM